MMECNRSALVGLGRAWLRVAVLSAVGGVAVGSLGQSAPAVASASSLTDVQRMIDRGHAAEALAQLDAIAATVPVPAGVLRLRGVALYSENKLPEAEKAFAAAVAADPADTTASQMRGITLYRLGRPKDAIPLLEAASKGAQPTEKRGSGPVDPQYVLALCYVDTRRYDDARHAFATQYGFGGGFGSGVSADGKDAAKAGVYSGGSGVCAQGAGTSAAASAGAPSAG